MKKCSVLLVTAGLGARFVSSTEKTAVLDLENFRMTGRPAQTKDENVADQIRNWSEQLCNLDVFDPEKTELQLVYNKDFPQNLLEAVKSLQEAGCRQIVITGRHSNVNLGYCDAFDALEEAGFKPILIHPDKKCKYEWLTKLFLEEGMSRLQVTCMENEWKNLKRNWNFMPRHIPVKSGKELESLLQFNDPGIEAYHGLSSFDFAATYEEEYSR